jgi:hypothetical protein
MSGFSIFFKKLVSMNFWDSPPIKTYAAATGLIFTAGNKEGQSN